MGDHKEVFRSLLELFPQVDHRILKAIAIEHHKDVDSAVVAVLDEVMPSMTNSDGALSANHEVLPSFPGALSANHEVLPSFPVSVGNAFANYSTHEVGSSSSFPGSVGNAFANYSTHEVGSSSSSGHDILGKEGNGSVHSAHDTSSVEVTTGTQENIDSELHEGRLTSIHVMSEQLTQHSDPIPNGDQHDLIPNLDAVSSNTRPERKLANLDTEVRCGILSACFSQLPAGANCGDSRSEAPQLHDQDSSNSPVGDCFAQDNSLKLFSGYEDINFDDDLFFSDLLAFSSKDQVSSGILISGKDSFSPVLDIPSPDTEGSFTGTSGVIEQKNTSNSGTDNKQLSGDILENDEIPLSSKMDMLPDLNLDHFASTASTHSSHSVSIECLEDSIADARSNKNDLLPSLELVTKMIEDVELLEEKAKVAKHESSVAGTGILTKVEELKEMLTHAMEANDMHASEVFGEKAILTTEARELQSRLQRLSDERNKNLVIIEEIRQTLDERLVAAQQEIAEAEKEKNEKEAAAQALLDEQEKMMNCIVEESRRLQKEAEENLKLKEFLVERGQIVDVLQGEIAVICEDVSLLKRVVDERLSLSRLQRSTMSSLSSSLHSSLHKSCSSSDRTTEAIESPDKHTVPEAASPVGRDLGDIPSTEEVSDVNDTIDKDICKRVDSNEDADGWELLEE